MKGKGFVSIRCWICKAKELRRARKADDAGGKKQKLEQSETREAKQKQKQKGMEKEGNRVPGAHKEQ